MHVRSGNWGVMARIVTYQNDPKYCFCQLKLESGERVLVSIGSGSIKIYKMLFWGKLPVKVIWQADKPDDIAFLLRREADFERSPLDLVVGKIIGCRSVEEIRARLLQST